MRWSETTLATSPMKNSRSPSRMRVDGSTGAMMSLLFLFVQRSRAWGQIGFPSSGRRFGGALASGWGLVQPIIASLLGLGFPIERANDPCDPLAFAVT
jgi:hypothetical protein